MRALHKRDSYSNCDQSEGPAGPDALADRLLGPGHLLQTRQRTLQSRLLTSRGADQPFHEPLGQGVAGCFGDPDHLDVGPTLEGIGEPVPRDQARGEAKRRQVVRGPEGVRVARVELGKP